MKVQKFKSTNQGGFTLLESLVGLLIFSIIILGSGYAISKMLNTQREININNIVINELQSRLQIATTESGDICSFFSSEPNNKFTLNNENYFIYCHTVSQQISEVTNQPDVIISWPVLGASKTQSKVKACAEGSNDSDCYRVGEIPTESQELNNE